VSTTAIRTVEVALESGGTGFANIDVLTGAPSTTGLTYVQMECERASLTPFGEPILQERMDARAGPHTFAPEYDTAVVSGSRASRLQGTVELTMVLRTLGDTSIPAAGLFDVYTGATGIPWVNILNTMWAADTNSGTGNLSDAVAFGGAVSVNEWQPTIFGAFATGNLVALPIDDRIEWSAVTDVPANVIVSPAFSRGPTDVSGDILRPARTFYPPNDLSTALGSSLSLKIDGADWQWLAFGCRAEVMKIARRGRMMTVSFTIRCAHIEPSSGSDLADFRTAEGSVAHQSDCYTVLGSTTSPTDGNSAPVQIGRSTIPVDEFEFTATQPLVARGTTEGLVGVSEWEVGDDPTYEMSMTASVPDNGISLDMVDMNARSVLVGFGPHGTGEGAAIYMPAAVMTTSPQVRDLGNGIVRQKLTYKNARWYGDSTGIETAHTSVRLGLSR
jgi:hypothetical protein